VRRVGEGVDHAHREGLDVPSRQAAQLPADVVLVELADHRPVAGDPLVDLHGVLQRGQRLGLGPDDPAGQPAGDERPGDLQDLPEPPVVTSPTMAPLPSRIALVATVVPCSTEATSDRPMPAAAQTCSMPYSTPMAWSAGVEAVFARQVAPLPSSTSRTSVKVPPTSTPSR
jgi:hypothetical protein